MSSMTPRQFAAIRDAMQKSPADLDPTTLYFVQGIVSAAIIGAGPRVALGDQRVIAGTQALSALLTDLVDLSDIAAMKDVSDLGEPPA